MIEESEFQAESKELYEKILISFEEFDPDEAEADFHLDNVTITFFGKTKFIVNRQPPVKQIWLATKKQGLHFNFDKASGKWICDRSGETFEEIFERSVSEILNKPFRLLT